MKLSDVIDCIILFITVFLLGDLNLMITDFNPNFRIILSLIISVTITAVYAKIKIKKHKRYVSDKKEEALYQKISDQLKLNTYEENRLFLERLLKADGKWLGVKLFFSFTFEKTSADYCISCYKKSQSDKTLIICSSPSEEALTLQKKLSQRITLLSDKQLFAIMKKTNIYPEISITLRDKRRRFKDLFKTAFNKRSAGRIIFCGIILLITSYFTLFPLYYVLIGSALCLWGLTAKFFGKIKA